MSINYVWEIVNMETKDETNESGDVLQNSVVRVTWKRVGTDTDGVTHSFLGSSWFTSVDKSTDSFVNFFSLTEDQVVGWLTDKLTDGEILKIDNIIERRIDKKNTIVRQAPWS